MPTPAPRPTAPRKNRNPGQQHWESIRSSKLSPSNSSGRPTAPTAKQLYSQESSGSSGNYSGGYDVVNNLSSLGGKTHSSDGGTASTIGSNTNTEQTREQEENPDNTWQDNTTAPEEDSQTDSNSKKGRFGKVIKQKGPVGAIIVVLLTLASVVSFFGGPGLMIVHVVENITEKYSLPLASVMESRTNQIIKAKLKNSTTGMCTPVSWRCKYASFSQREIDAFKRVGIEIDGEVKSFSIGGKQWVKPAALKFKDRVITAGEFDAVRREIPEFADALKSAYNPRFASLSNNLFDNLLGKLRTSKKAPFEEGDDTDEKRLKRVQNTVKEGHSATKASSSKNSDDKNYTGDDPDGCNEECAKRSEATSELNSAADSTTSETNNLLKATKTGALDTVTKTIKLTGAVDDVCTVYGMYKATALGVKIIRNQQLIRFAMMTLSTGSMIKAMNEFENGNTEDLLTPENVAFIGTLWSQTMRRSDGTETKAATESFGAQYVFYGDSSIDDAASAFTNGGSFGGSNFGKIDSVVQGMLGYLGGAKKADSTCKINNNPFVQGAVVIGSLALMLIPGVGQGLKFSTLAIQGITAAALAVAQAILPGILADIISGNVLPESFNDLAGEVTGNATVSGAGSLMSMNGRQSLAPLTSSQARANQAFYQKYNQEYARYERSTHSPLDISNKYTFMGSIYSQFIPTFGKLQSGSIGGIFSALGQIASAPSKILSTRAQAATGETYNTCKDVEYRDLDLATDPFCNIVYGTDTYTEPEELANSLTSSGDIDDNGNPTGEFTKWSNRCNKSDTPIGNTGTDSTESDGSECLLGDGKKSGSYSTFNVDKLILDTMENGYSTGGVSDSTTQNASASTSSGQAVGEPELAEAQSELAGYSNGELPDSELAELSFAPGKKMQKQAAAAMEEMNKAYNAETGSNLGINETYRDCKTQIAYATPGNPQYQGGRAAPAPPCQSKHGWGLAVDINVGGFGSAVYNWLKANASKYGFVHPAWAEPGGSKPEAWHWEYARRVGGST